MTEMNNLGVKILFEDNHLLVLDKPAPLATMGAEEGEPSLVSWGKDYLKQKYEKPGNVFLGVVSRLDSFTTGAIVLARTSKAASRLSEQFRKNKVGKLYLAVSESWVDLTKNLPESSQLRCEVESTDAEPFGQTFFQNLSFPIQWNDEVYKDDHARRMRVKAEGKKGAGQGEKIQTASLHLCALAHSARGQLADRSLSLVRLITGRKHQIRVQFSSRGTPIFGDQKYQADHRMSKGIALHCYGLQFQHPTTKEVMTFFSKPSKVWNTVGEFQLEPQLWETLLSGFQKSCPSSPPLAHPIQGNVQQVMEEFEKNWFDHSLPANVFCS